MTTTIEGTTETTAANASTIRPPMVCYAQVFHATGHPGVGFVWPYHSGSVDTPIGKSGYTVPMIIVRPGTPPEDVLKAAEEFGRSLQLVQPLRAAVKTWLKSYDADHDPALTSDEQVERRHGRPEVEG
jgi:hypothetical protein